MRWGLIVGWLFVLLPTKLVAQEKPAPDRQQVAALIEQLGDEAYATRETASRHLLELGEASIAQLAEATKNGDAEIRYRAQWLLTMIEQRRGERYLASLDQRIKRFLEDQNATLPGWRRFRKTAGDDLTARRLFAAMHRAEPSLLLAYSESSATAELLWKLRMNQLGERYAKMPTRREMNSTAALLWIALNGDLNLSSGDCNRLSDALKRLHPQAEKETTLHAMIRKWVLDVEHHKPLEPLLREKLSLAHLYDFKKEGTRLAVKMLDGSYDFPHPWKGHFLTSAIFYLYMQGDASHLPVIQRHLDDETPVWNQGRPGEVQLRDVALGVSVHLSGQRLSDYYFLEFERHKSAKVQACQFKFDDPETREKAVKKWRAWSRNGKNHN